MLGPAGPVDPLLGSRELFAALLKAKYAKIEDYPLYQELIKFSEKAGDAKQVEPEKKHEKPDSKAIEESKENGAASKPDKSKPDAKHWKRDYNNLNKNEKE